MTTKSDVYSFGVVLLELATGLRALESLADGTKQNLVEAVRTVPFFRVALAIKSVLYIFYF